MNAFVLAAGLGTRLKPWTEKHPKALVPVAEVPMLKRVLERLVADGFDNIVVNVHHFSEQIVDYLSENDFGADIRISDESDRLLDTGGGIVKAYGLFNNDEPVLVHNVDILSNADLKKLMADASENDDASALLLVSDRESSRKLYFDDMMRLGGWHNLKTGEFKPAGFCKRLYSNILAFSGIYVIKKSGVEEMKELFGDGPFPVMDYFLHQSRVKMIYGKKDSGLNMIDIGKPESLAEASRKLGDIFI